MYTTRWCGYCVRAKALLDSRGLAYEEVNLDDDPHFRRKLNELTGGWTVPQILIDDTPDRRLHRALAPGQVGRAGALRRTSGRRRACRPTSGGSAA